MENVLSVARCFYKLYFEQHHNNIDEMKMHKLMYLAQRESLIENNKFLFDATFYGWKFGPVLKEIREEYRLDNPFQNSKLSDKDETLNIVRVVLRRYGDMSSWDLSSLSHQELSWRQARKGLEPGENGNRKLSNDMIKVDAIRERLVRTRYSL